MPLLRVKLSIGERLLVTEYLPLRTLRTPQNFHAPSRPAHLCLIVDSAALCQSHITLFVSHGNVNVLLVACEVVVEEGIPSGVSGIITE